ATSNGDLIGFFRSGASVFGLCIGATIVFKSAGLLYEYGSTFNVSKEALSAARLMLPMIQSFIPVAVCLFTTWYLASCSGRASAYARVHGQWSRVTEAEYQSSATLVAYKRAVQGRTANGRDSRPGT